MSDINLRTREGVETFAREWHKTLKPGGDVARNLATSAYLMITRHPNTGEHLDSPKLFRLDFAPTLTLSNIVELIGSQALERGAVGVALCMPVVVADQDADREHGVITLNESGLSMAFAVEHMDKSVGRRVWTADVRVEDKTVASVGDLVEQGEGFLWEGWMRDTTLLPQKHLN
jgi:hypothetical protein